MGDITWHDIGEFEPEVDGVYFVRMLDRTIKTGRQAVNWDVAEAIFSDTLYCNGEAFVEDNDGSWFSANDYRVTVLTHFAVINEPEESNGAD